MSRKPQRRKVEQPMPEEVVGRLVDFVSRKFYPGRPGSFGKDRREILSRVIFYPAVWLKEKGVTLPPKRYEDILTGILQGALDNMAGKINWMPAYLGTVVEKHFFHQGEKYYDEAKSMRNQVADLMAGMVQREPVRDIVEEFCKLDRLLKATKGRKTISTVATKQGELFG